jgi:ABC-type branched-subunit amino acid transport system substrate-binding protein
LRGLGALAVASSLLFAACGDDNKSSGSGSDAGAKPATADTTAVGKQASDFSGVAGGPEAGQGKTWKIGATLPLSGGGAFFAKEMKRGIDLAVEHIEQAGGPKIEVVYKDGKTGDANAGIQAARELGQDKIPAVINAYLANLGSMLPGLKTYKMLSLDPGGGTGQTLREQPYFWGARASWPDAPYPGIYKYVADKLPDAKRVALVIWDNGKPFVDSATASLKKSLSDNGLELVATEKVPVGATDFSTTIARLKNVNPDVVQLAISGADIAFFLKGYANSGIKAQAIGPDWSPDIAKSAGAAATNFWYSFDYFDPAAPPTAWSKFYAAEFKKKYGFETTWLAANYYETMFAYWKIYANTLKAGKDVNSGSDLQDTLVADSTFKSVYGGTPSTVGEFSFDTKSHTIAVRDLSLLQVIAPGQAKLLASFGIPGDNFKVVADPDKL